MLSIWHCTQRGAAAQLARCKQSQYAATLATRLKFTATCWETQKFRSILVAVHISLGERGTHVWGKGRARVCRERGRPFGWGGDGRLGGRGERLGGRDKILMKIFF